MAALALTACSAGSAPEPSSASDPTPAPSTVVETAAPVETETPEPTADAGAEESADQERCELRVQESFADRGVRLTTEEDTAAVAQALTMPVLPGRATCGGVMDDDNYTQLIWVDQPLVAPELLEVLGSRGWEASEEQAMGYAITVYDEGNVHGVGRSDRRRQHDEQLGRHLAGHGRDDPGLRAAVNAVR